MFTNDHLSDDRALLGSLQVEPVTFENQPTFEEIGCWARAQIDPGLSVEVHPDDTTFTYVVGKGRSREVAWQEYFWMGKEIVFLLEQILRWTGRSWQDVRQYLDFASGYGRSTRFVMRVMPRERISISDIVAPAVEFQRDYLGVHGFVSCVAPEEVEFDREYDLISVISLFSHLPEGTFEGWLRKLVAALSDGGILVFTTHDLQSIEDCGHPPVEGDFAFLPVSETEDLDRASYGSTFCNPRFVQGLLERIPGASLLAHWPRGLNRHQDLYVVGKGIEKPATPCLLRSHVRVHVELGTVGADSGVRLEGWALGEDLGRVQSVRVYLDGDDAGEAALGLDRSDVAKYFGPPAVADCGWRFETDWTGRKPRWGVVLVRSAASAEVVVTELVEVAVPPDLR